jgi:two-component system, NtrC family, response regulator AtoC
MCAKDRRYRATILIVEDDSGMRRLLDDELRDQGYEVQLAKDVSGAIAAVHELQPDVIVADLRLPDGTALDILSSLRQLSNPPAFIVITAFGSIAQAVDALKEGADDFLPKPLNLDHLSLRLERTLEVHRLKGLVREQQSAVNKRCFHGMIGQSAPMRHLFDKIRQIAKASGPVLILGESGVGKEMVARAIHSESARSEGAFVPINCAALPEGLVESELFGHTEGSFTGAVHSRKGLIESAIGGTVLLDELTELPLPVQAKILRTLQESTLRRLGANHEQGVDVRIIAATNGDIERQIDAGELRRDLYYRLETFVLEVPPLREHPEDIEPLVALFLSRYQLALGRQVEGFSSEALEALRSYDFPGNVRELENIIERGITFCRHGEVRPEHLGIKVVEQYKCAKKTSQILHALVDKKDLPSLEALKRSYIRYVLNLFDGNKRRTAASLGIGRRTLYRYLESDETDLQSTPLPYPK